MPDLIIIYFFMAAGVLATWLMICWIEGLKINLFIAATCSLFWIFALVYVTARTARYAIPWVVLRLYRDAQLALGHRWNAHIDEGATLRAPRETGMYD